MTLSQTLGWAFRSPGKRIYGLMWLFITKQMGSWRWKPGWWKFLTTICREDASRMGQQLLLLEFASNNATLFSTVLSQFYLYSGTHHTFTTPFLPRGVFKTMNDARQVNLEWKRTALGVAQTNFGPCLEVDRYSREPISAVWGLQKGWQSSFFSPEFQESLYYVPSKIKDPWVGPFFTKQRVSLVSFRGMCSKDGISTSSLIYISLNSISFLGFFKGVSAASSCHSWESSRVWNRGAHLASRKGLLPTLFVAQERVSI